MIARFEETVKQEIINHNKSIAQSNNSLNEVKKAIEYLDCEITKCKNLHTSEFTFVANQFGDLSEYVEVSKQELNSKINDLQPIIANINEKIDELAKLFVDVAKNKENLSAHITQMAQLFLAVGEHFQELETNFNNQIARLEKSFIQKLEKIVQDINLPSQLQLINQNLNAKIDENKQILRSLHEENAILKKEMHIQKKYLEKHENLFKRYKLAEGE
jgi:predicted  nucleic acid-binding Zn-ribbon protein